MTDRVKALTVILEKDIRTDDCDSITIAIEQLKGVLSVQTHISNVDDEVIQTRVRQELGVKLWKILYPNIA